jgi:hypothetical protein
MEATLESKQQIHHWIEEIASEMLRFIRGSEPKFFEGWVPATFIKRELNLNFECYPKSRAQHGRKGWLFSIVARYLEDRDLLEYRFSGKNAYYRSKS